MYCEILVVAALVGADGDGVGILLDRGAHDVGDAAVVAQMHHFGAVRLQQAPDHVDRGIVAVEQGGGGNEAQRRLAAPSCSAAAPRRSRGPAFMGSLRAGRMTTGEYDPILSGAFKFAIFTIR